MLINIFLLSLPGASPLHVAVIFGHTGNYNFEYLIVQGRNFESLSIISICQKEGTNSFKIFIDEFKLHCVTV